MSEQIKKWSEISIFTTNEAVEPITNILEQAGTSGMVVKDAADLTAAKNFKYGAVYELDPAKFPKEGVWIKTYLPETYDAVTTANNIRSSIEQLKDFGIEIGENRVEVAEIHEEDWANNWKQYFKPLRISDKITIKPTWEDYQPSSEELIIEMDPGMAFGTGSHATTKLSLRALEKSLKEGDVVIDVGSGSGVLSIAAALLHAKKVYAYDLDDVAVKSTKVNAELNGLSEKIIVKQNNLLDGVSIEADLIISNILAEIIVQFVDEAWTNLKVGGHFITSGIIRDKQQLVVDAIEQKGFQIIDINELEDWISIVAKKGD